MAKTIKEMIEVMDWFDKGGEIEGVEQGYESWRTTETPIWNWEWNDYRIKKPKQKIKIEKWLVEDNNKNVVVEASDIDAWLKYLPKARKIKLIESYEVEI